MKVHAHTPNLSRDAQRFYDMLNLMIHDVLKSPAGGSITITVPESVDSAQAEMSLNPVPMAQRHDGFPVPETISVEAESESHVETSGNGISGLVSGSVSATETPCNFPFGSL